MKPISNFHTHTYLCKHAIGTPLDFVKAASDQGCTMLGFSDHCPYPNCRSDVWLNIRMDASEAPLYTKLVRDAAKTVNFPVYLGFECEFSPEFESWYRDSLKGEFGADYLVFGPHWVLHEGEYLYIPEVTDKKIVHDYFDNIIKGLSTGLFSFLAHPDLIMMSGRNWTPDLQSCFESVIDAAIDLNIPLEVNGLGLVRTLVTDIEGERHPYPVDHFWEIVSKKGARVICNSDAHECADVIRNAQLSRDYAAKFGIVPIENPLVN